MSTIISKSQRPVRTYTTGPITRALRWFAVLSTVGITAWLLVRYPSLPDTVATHFDARGEASILVLAGVMLLLSLGFAALSTRPRAFNYPLEITTRNAQAIYREGERMMVWTLLAMVVVYLGIAWSVLETGGAPLIAAGLAVMVAAVVVGVIRLVRAGR